MTRAQKIRVIKALRAEGNTYGAIAGLLNMAASGVRRLATQEPTKPCAICGKEFEPQHGREKTCSPECWHEQENNRKRRWDKTTGRGTCVDCGKLMGRGSKGRYLRCKTCQQRCEAERVHERALEIEEWWAEGLTLRQIASELGRTKGHAAKDIFDLRSKGYNLPYRRAVHSTPDGKPRFPEQVV